METLCRIRDIYRAIAEFEVQFMQEFDLSLNEGYAAVYPAEHRQSSLPAR